MWIKESLRGEERIITAKANEFILNDVTIFHFDKKYFLKKINAKEAEIKTNNWTLSDVIIFTPSNGLYKKERMSNYNINSIYDYEKIINLFNNSDTLSFLDLIIDYNNLLEKDIQKNF